MSEHPAAFWARRIGIYYHPDNNAESYIDRDGYALSGAERDRYMADHENADWRWIDVAMSEWCRIGLIDAPTNLFA